jgi:4-amino-4-deoxy-L-arabinose transferase-like glycosyltransferase
MTMVAAASPRRASEAVFLLLLLVAALMRLHLASAEPYVHDESNTSIPLSQTISFAPDALHLPLRGENHGALPAYVVKASSTVFGTTPLGFRLMHVLLGLATIGLVYRATREWQGPVAARWAAALLAFNEYYLAVSARATAHVPHLFFVTVAVVAFGRFLRLQRPRYLYVAGASAALAFYCKEHAALLLPLFLLALLHPSHRRWLRSPHVYLAAAGFVALLVPDLLWNLRTNPEVARVSYGSGEAAQATYSQHLQRIGGIGLSPYPTMFYTRSAVQRLHVQVTGRELRDETPEYPSINPALGALLLGSLLLAVVRPGGRDRLMSFLLLVFWGMFGFFTLIKPGNPPGRLDPASWIWIEATIVPAVIVTAIRLSRMIGWSRLVWWSLCGALLVYAAAAPALAMSRRGLAATRNGVDGGNHALQVLAIGTVESVRRHPLRAIAVAAGGGAAVGLSLGFCSGWFARGRRLRDDSAP